MRPVKKIVISLALVVPLAVLGFAHVAKTAPVITRFTPQAKWCGNASIVFFPGGPAGGVFANNVYNGARQAELDLGPKVRYVFSDWDPQKMTSQFKEVAATKPDGIAVMGHPGDDAFYPLIKDAEAKALSSPVKTPRCLAPRRNLPVGGSATSVRICMAPGLPWAQKPRNEPGFDPAIGRWSGGSCLNRREACGRKA